MRPQVIIRSAPKNFVRSDEAPVRKREAGVVAGDGDGGAIGEDGEEERYRVHGAVWEAGWDL